MLVLVSLFVLISNVVLMLWFLTKPSPGSSSALCPYALHTRGSDGSCTKVDGVGVAALAFGAIALTIPVRILYNFCTAKLIRLPGEEHSKCHLDNAKPLHAKSSSIQAKTIGTAVFFFELAVALIPLNPIYYLLMLGPAACSGLTGVQAYLKL